MKKIALSLLCGVLMGSFVMPVMAQELTQKRKTAVFSPAVMEGSVAQAQKGQVKKTLPKTARTIILRFEPGQIELSDVQKELLLHVAEQINTANSPVRVVATGASKKENDASDRIGRIESFLRAYVTRYFDYSARFIHLENIVPSVDNTVKITINR